MNKFTCSAVKLKSLKYSSTRRDKWMKQKELFIIQMILKIKSCQKSLALRLYREILNQGTSVLSSSKINPAIESRHWWWWWLMTSAETDKADEVDEVMNWWICEDWPVMGRWWGAHNGSMKALRQRMRKHFLKDSRKMIGWQQRCVTVLLDKMWPADVNSW